jgi:hypothetical protein
LAALLTVGADEGDALNLLEPVSGNQQVSMALPEYRLSLYQHNLTSRLSVA